MKGKRREEIVAEIGNKTVNVYRAEEAEKKTQDGDFEPPNLPSSPVLRTARYEMRKKNILHRDPIQALRILKFTDEKFVIRDIGFDPFFVHYWSRHQLDIFKKYAAKGQSRLCLDATGSIIKKMTKYNDIKSKSIYLYHGVIQLDEGQFSVLQMITERQTTNSIHSWLMEWIRSGAPRPSEVVIDGGRALLTGAIRAFTNCSTIHDYSDTCYGPTLPSCYIRMDNAHYIHTWVQLLKDVPSRIGIFYKAAIGQLIITTTREVAKKIIRALLIVSLCETDGNLPDGTHTKTEESCMYLKALVTDENINPFSNEYAKKPIEPEENDSDNEENGNGQDKLKSQTKTLSNRWLNGEMRLIKR